MAKLYCRYTHSMFRINIILFFFLPPSPFNFNHSVIENFLFYHFLAISNLYSTSIMNSIGHYKNSCGLHWRSIVAVFVLIVVLVPVFWLSIFSEIPKVIAMKMFFTPIFLHQKFDFSDN